MTYWEYCILTRLSAGLDTKWFVNRVFHHNEADLPDEVTEAEYRRYNERFDKLHASHVYPILPAVLNLLGSEGWELIDDMATGITGGEGLVFKRQLPGKPRANSASKAGAKKTAASKSTARKAASKKTAARS
jgi:hypothetical protein